MLLILAGVTINLAVNNQGIFSKAKTATSAYKNATEEEQKGIDEADKEIAKYMPKGTTLSISSFPKISVSGLKYADLDGDGTADGIIVADISKASTDKTTYKMGNPWCYSGSFTYTKKDTSELRKYLENTYKYTNADGSQVDGTLIKCTNNTGTPRYYVLSLANYDGNDHYWYKNAWGKMSDSLFTLDSFGKGKENTEKMIERMKNHANYEYDYGEPTTGENADIWNIIEDKVKEGWFVPSNGEWAAFASYLNTSSTNYERYGLSNNSSWWSSSQYDGGRAWVMGFGNMGCGRVNLTLRLRLCAK